MAAINQKDQPRTSAGGGNFEETDDQKRGWARVKRHIETRKPRVLVGNVFTVKGVVSKIILNNGGYFNEPTNYNGKEGTRNYTKMVARITDERLVVNGAPLEFPVKKVGASFFDGWTYQDGKRVRGTARGKMWELHVAVYQEEPPAELVNDEGSWETGDYTDRPVLLQIKYDGPTTDDRYKDQRAGMTLWLQGFEADPDVEPPSYPDRPDSPDGDLDEFGDDPEDRGEFFDRLLGENPVPAASGGSGRTTGRGPTTSRQGDDESIPDDFDDFTPPGDEDRPEPSRGSGRGTRLRSALQSNQPAASAGAAAPTAAVATATPASPGAEMVTDRQLKFIAKIGAEAGLTEEEIQAWSLELYAVETDQLARSDASAFIAALQRRRNEVA